MSQFLTGESFHHGSAVPRGVRFAADLPRPLRAERDLEGRGVGRFLPKQSFLDHLQTKTSES